MSDKEAYEKIREAVAKDILLSSYSILWDSLEPRIKRRYKAVADTILNLQVDGYAVGVYEVGCRLPEGITEFRAATRRILCQAGYRRVIKGGE